MNTKWKVTAGAKIIREGRFFWENWICRNRKDATLATFRITLWGQDEHVVRRNGIKGIFLRAAIKIGRYTARLLASRHDRWVSVWGNVPKTLHQKHQVLCPSEFNQYDVLHSRKGEYIRLQEEVNYPTAKGIIRLEHPRRLRWTLRVCLVRYGSLYTTQHVLWFAFIRG